MNDKVFAVFFIFSTSINAPVFASSINALGVNTHVIILLAINKHYQLGI